MRGKYQQPVRATSKTNGKNDPAFIFVKQYFKALQHFERKEYAEAGKLYAECIEIYENNDDVKEKRKNTQFRVTTDTAEMMSLPECYAVINNHHAHCLNEIDYKRAMNHQEKANVLRKMIQDYGREWNEYENKDAKKLEVCRQKMIDAFCDLAKQYCAMDSYYKAFNMYASVINLSLVNNDVVAENKLEDHTETAYLCFNVMISCLKNIEKHYDSFLLLKYLGKFEKQYQQAKERGFTDKQKNTIETEVNNLKKKTHDKQTSHDAVLEVTANKKPLLKKAKEPTTESSFFNTENKQDCHKSQQNQDKTTKRKSEGVIGGTKANKKRRIDTKDKASASRTWVKAQEQRSIIERFFPAMPNNKERTLIFKACINNFCKQNQENITLQSELLRIIARYFRKSMEKHADGKIGIIPKGKYGSTLMTSESLYQSACQLNNNKAQSELDYLYQFHGELFSNTNKMRNSHGTDSEESSSQSEQVESAFNNFFTELEALYSEHLQELLPSILYEIGYHLKDKTAKTWFISNAVWLGHDLTSTHTENPVEVELLNQGQRANPVKTL